jgi:CheY-like chemotaxis protein
LGIGLALSSALVAMHDGTITAHSDGLGRGSEFVVRLPVAAPEPATPMLTFDQPVASSDNARCRVLVVDDNQDVALPMARWMRQLGHEVRVALDGPAAIQLADEFRPEVVLLDIGMPNMNGYEVARALRSISWGRELVLVAVTGWGQEDDQRRSAEAGFDRHMTKPVDPLVLESFLESIACQHVATPREPAWRTNGVTAGATSGT